MKRRFENRKDGLYWESEVQCGWTNLEHGRLTTKSGMVGKPGGKCDSQEFETVQEAATENLRCIKEKQSTDYEEVTELGSSADEPFLLRRLVAERSENSLPNLIDPVGDELEAWRKLSAEADLSSWAKRMVFKDHIDPRKISFSDLTANMSGNIYGWALVCAAFSNLEFLCGWDNDDDRTYLASRTPTTWGIHRVYWFIPRTLCLDDKSWPSITSFFWRDREKAEEQPPMVPQYLDPIMLSRRSKWLTCALAGVGSGSIEHDMDDVANLGCFFDEVELLAEHPHLACYWLLHQYIAGNTDMFETAMEKTGDSSHPWVIQIRKLLSEAGLGTTLRIGALNDEYLELFAQNAPDRAFGE